MNNKMKIALIDDDDLSRESIAQFIEEQLEHEVVQFNSGVEALEDILKNEFDLVITDLMMPGLSGIEVLSEIKGNVKSQNIDVVIITGFGNMETTLQAMRLGVSDYLQKPINIEELATIVEKIELKKNSFSQNLMIADKKTDPTKNLKIGYIEKKFSNIRGLENVVFFSKTMKNILDTVDKLHNDRTVPILIEGETGCGKEIISQLVHYGNGETEAPFITLNCSALSSNLFESELFGYEDGAFTGAKKGGMRGKLEIANGGTLFLDEIGELPLELQPKLLRFLQQKEIYRVGGTKKILLDVRIIGATNKNLQKMVSENKFRSDLYFRMNVGNIKIPPLRDRKEAIVPFAKLFLDKYSEKKEKNFRFINKEAVKILEEYKWPGNIRELQNTIERIVLLYDNSELLPEYLDFLGHGIEYNSSIPNNILIPGNFSLPKEKLNIVELENEIVLKAFKLHDGNKTKTSEYLGITRSALRSRLKNAGIE